MYVLSNKGYVSVSFNFFPSRCRRSSFNLHLSFEKTQKSECWRETDEKTEELFNGMTVIEPDSPLKLGRGCSLCHLVLEVHVRDELQSH
jgi:hypothetical protein